MFRVRMSFKTPSDETVGLNEEQQALYVAHEAAAKAGDYAKADEAYEELRETFWDDPMYDYIDDIYRPDHLKRDDENWGK